MKTLLNRFQLLTVALWLAVVPLGIVGCGFGCQSTSKTTYAASGVTHIAAVTALKGWNEYLGNEYASILAQSATDPDKAGKRKTALLAKEEQVKAAYEKYRASQIVVLTAAQEFGREPSATGQDKLSAAVAASAATLASLLDLLKTFGVKL